MPRIERSAQLVWEGNVARGTGSISAGTGAFADLGFSLPTRIGQPEGKTSPEELLAAAHGGCITMSLASELTQAGTPPGRLDVACRILMDEDPGNAPRVSKIWLYSIGTGELIQVVAHNPRFFDPSVPNNPDFITQDEESSGIIDASHILERGWFLLDVQAHKLSSDPELVEGGQLLALFVDPRIGASGHDPDGDHDGDDHDDDDRGDDRSGHGGDGRR